MSQNQAYQRLRKHFRQLCNLQHLGGIASWDEAVMMPVGGIKPRAEAIAELQVMINEMLCDPRLPEWLAEARAGVKENEKWALANLREMAREVDQATAVEASLVEAKTRASLFCEQAWRELRPKNDWQGLLPKLEEVVHLTRKEAEQRSSHCGLGLYDSLMDLYEPGMRSEKVDVLFSELKSFLLDFIKKVVEKQKSEDFKPFQGLFSIESQRQLSLEVMKIIGFDFNRGRLDVSHHPFCGGVAQDVRITTRYSKENFSESLLSVMHETGHAVYEQGLPQDWLYQPVGASRSIGIHESQSLLFEMQVGRSFHFLCFVSEIFRRHLGGAHPHNDWSADNLYRCFTRVKPDYIRVQADEVTYPVHVILRYEIEKDLIEGAVEVKDLPEIWNQKMQEYLGLSTEGKDKDGVMQDVHWMKGAIGYFPTYTLGAMNATQIFQAVFRQHSNLLEDLEKGDLSQLRTWLSEKIWSYGCYFEVKDLMCHATGEELNPKYFEHHLQYRYLDR